MLQLADHIYGRWSKLLAIGLIPCPKCSVRGHGCRASRSGLVQVLGDGIVACGLRRKGHRSRIIAMKRFLSGLRLTSYWSAAWYL
jgi:hypothetical protein